MSAPAHPAYRPDVDGLRAVAVGSVVLFHAAPGRLPGGFVGVDVFFVISGFLITGIIAGGIAQGQFSFAQFYMRRIRRIFPALAVVLAACLGLGALLLTPDELAPLGKHVATGAGFVANLALWRESGYFDTEAMFKPLLHLWSLGVEEQFYFVWPALVLAAHRLIRRPGALLLACALLAGVSFAWSVQQSHADPAAAYFSPLTRFWELLVGALLALGAGRGPAAAMTLRHAASLTGLALLGAAFVLVDESKPFPGWWALLPTLGAAMLIWAGPQAWVNRRVLALRPLVWLGLISYPLYLWHWPLIAFPRILRGEEIEQTTRLIMVLGAVLLAWATYRWVELPLRRRPAKQRMAKALSGAMALVLLAGLSAWTSHGWAARPWAPQVVNRGEIGAAPYFVVIAQRYHPCLPLAIRQQALVGEQYLRCPQSQAGPAQDLAILGDSHGEALFPGLAEAMPQRNLVFYGIGEGLPFTRNPDYAQVFAHVRASPSIRTVIIAAVWPRKLAKLDEAAWRADLTATIAALRAAGRDVWLADDVPTFSFLPTRCKFSGRPGQPNRCDDTDPPAATAYLPAFDQIAGATGARRLRLHQLFCAAGRCSMARGGELLFRDAHHLGLAGSRLAGRSIAASMNQGPQP